MTSQRFFLISFLFCFAPACAMNKQFSDDPHGQHKVDTMRATNGVLHYMKDHALTLANANSELYKNSDFLKKCYGKSFEETVYAPIKIKTAYKADPSIDLPRAIVMFVAAPEDIKRVMLAQMGFEEKRVQDSFFAKPIDVALHWLTYCRNRHRLLTIKDLSLEITENLPLETRCMLTYDQFFCIEGLLLGHCTQKAGIAQYWEIGHANDKYVEGDSLKEVEPFVFVTSEQQHILSSLPEPFMQHEEVKKLLAKIKGAEKPSMISRTISMPLSMMLHSVRDTYPSFNPCTSRMWFAISVGTVNLILQIADNRDLLTMHPIMRDFNCSLALSLAGNVGFPALFKLIIDNPRINEVDQYNTCVIKHPMHVLQLRNVGFAIATTLNILFQRYILNSPIPFPSIFAGFALFLASFMTYDYFKYDRKYAIKTQSFADLIETHKKEAKRWPLCTLL